MSTGIWSGVASICPASTPNAARWRRDPAHPGAGGVLVAGVIGIVAGLRQTQGLTSSAATGAGWDAWVAAFGHPADRILILVGLAVGVLAALLTGWLVAALLVPATLAGLPVLLSPPPAASKIDRLEAMEVDSLPVGGADRRDRVGGGADRHLAVDA